MVVDPLEVARQTVADFGIPVLVAPLNGEWPYEISALFSPVTADTGLGQARGAMATHRFRCLPEEVAELAEGDLLTPVGTENEYAVFEVVRIPGRLIEVRVVAR